MAFLPMILGPAIGAVTAWGLNKLDQSGAPGAGQQGGYGKVRTGTKAAEQFQKQLFKTGGGLPRSPLYNLGADTLQGLLQNTPQSVAQFQEPYVQNFYEQIVPGIAERFAGMGTGSGALNSSGFQQTIAQAGRGLQRDLAAMRQQQQMQAVPQALQYAQQPFQNMLAAMQWSPYQSTYTPRQPGAYDYMAQAAPGLIQSAIGNTNWGNMFGGNGGGTPMNTLGGYQNAIQNATFT
jgi:hypothetical protein